MRRTTSIVLVGLSLASAAIASVACSSGGASGGPTPSPSPSGTPFNPIGCQIVWYRQDPPGGTHIDYYIVDGPVSHFMSSGTNGYYIGDTTGATNVTGAFVYHYDVNAKTSDAAIIATSGVFSIGVDPTNPTKIGNPVNFLDSTPQHYYRIDSSGNLAADEGSSGTGTFSGLWSDPSVPDPTLGSGAMHVLFEGSAFDFSDANSHDYSFAECYTQKSTLQSLSTKERIAEAGRRVAEAIRAR